VQHSPDLLDNRVANQSGDSGGFWTQRHSVAAGLPWSWGDQTAGPQRTTSPGIRRGLRFPLFSVGRFIAGSPSSRSAVESFTTKEIRRASNRAIGIRRFSF